MNFFHQWCHEQVVSHVPGYELHALSPEAILLTYPSGDGASEILDGFRKTRTPLPTEDAPALLRGSRIESDAYMAGLRAGVVAEPPSEPEAREAVAWRYHFEGWDDDHWAVVLRHPGQHPKYTVQPLYTHAAPATADQMRTALDVNEAELAVLLEVLAYAGDEVANTSAASSLFLKAEALATLSPKEEGGG